MLKVTSGIADRIRGSVSRQNASTPSSLGSQSIEPTKTRCDGRGRTVPFGWKYDVSTPVGTTVVGACKEPA